MKEHHFKKFRSQVSGLVKEYEGHWKKALVDAEGEFYSAATTHLNGQGQSFMHNRHKWSLLEQSQRSNLIIYPVFESIMRRCPVKYSFAALTTMPEFRWLSDYMMKTFGGPDPRGFVEQLSTVWVTWFSDFSLRECGDKVYVVKPDMRWALENTELKGYPADDLRLPFPAIYVDVEGLIEIYNPNTGMHKSLGVYVVEDNERTPRIWRILAVGKGKPDSPFGEEHDDALYHFQMYFPEGMTIDDALQYTFASQLDAEAISGEIMFEGRIIKVAVGSTEESKEHFEMMWQNLATLFRYVMNVVVYSTTQDADVLFRATSPEYLAMRARGLKAQGDKRRRIFDALKSIDPGNAYVVGGNIIIDRQPKAASDLVEDNERRRQRVRSLVSGHYHTYLIGTGRSASIRKWLSPYWRGPEHAPLTTKTRVVK